MHILYIYCPVHTQSFRKYVFLTISTWWLISDMSNNDSSRMSCSWTAESMQLSRKTLVSFHRGNVTCSIWEAHTHMLKAFTNTSLSQSTSVKFSWPGELSKQRPSVKQKGSPYRGVQRIHMIKVCENGSLVLAWLLSGPWMAVFSPFVGSGIDSHSPGNDCHTSVKSQPPTEANHIKRACRGALLVNRNKKHLLILTYISAADTNRCDCDPNHHLHWEKMYCLDLISQPGLSSSTYVNFQRLKRLHKSLGVLYGWQEESDTR